MKWFFFYFTVGFMMNQPAAVQFQTFYCIRPMKTISYMQRISFAGNLFFVYTKLHFLNCKSSWVIAVTRRTNWFSCFFRSLLSSSFWAFSLYNMSVYVCDYVCLSKSDNKRLGANAFSYYHLFILFIYFLPWEKNRSSWQITFWQDFVGSVYCKITMRLKIFRPFCSAFSHSHINNRKTVFWIEKN